MGDESLRKEMAAFGLRLVGMKRSTGIPTFAAGMVISCRPEDGRRGRTVGLHEPDRVAMANADWFALAHESRLFSGSGRFLLAVKPPSATRHESGERVWALVELLEHWDIVGAGAASGLLGSGYGSPAFCMSAVDGSVFVQGTAWRDSIGTCVLPKPYCVPSLRDLVRRNIGKPYRTLAENEDAIAWLKWQ
jgi:hypothetical protein